MKSFRSLILLVFLVFLIQVSQTFIIEVRQGEKKCFGAEQSPDKTLEVKFGFPRRQKQNCDVLFSVNLNDGQLTKSSIYHDMHRCHQMHPGQFEVVKHTSESYQMNGKYQICYEIIQDNNQNLMIEIFIGQKLNPLLYSDGEDVLPLIKSQQLIDLDLKIQQIRKSIGWSRKLLNESRELGYQLEANLEELDSFTLSATVVQIIFLAGYAVFWVAFMRIQKLN